MAHGGFSGLVSVASVPDWTVRGVGDIKGDGFADIVIQYLDGLDSQNGTICYANMAGGHFSGWVLVGNTPGWQVRGVADFNGDGYADVLIQNNNSTAPVVFANMHNGQNGGY